MDKKATGIVSYITIIGWLVAYFAGDKEGAKFHLNQSLVLAIAEIIVSVASSLLAGVKVVSILLSLVSLVLFVFWIMGLVAAIKEEEKEIPVIGGIKILK